jgi:hypothetical protein
MSVQSRKIIDDTMLHRIYSEFLEMPGLRLSCTQAQRLFGLDEPTCQELLDALVEAKFLSPPLNGAYSRLADGSAKPPRLRKATGSFGDTKPAATTEAV